MTHNVLVVDDEPKLCDLLTQALSQNGIQVFSAGNGLHALKVLGRRISTWSSATGACRAWTGRRCWPRSRCVIRLCR